jgi:hypothetical protein
MEPSTGLTGLDAALKGLILGDNIVWEVESIEDYAPFVRAFYRQADKLAAPFVYFRFARHRELIPADAGVETVHLDPERGFESFISEMHQTIDRCGRGAYYVFDSLSELAVDWSSDRMVGNFFMLICPYLYDRDTITFFGLIRNMHSFRALQPITETTQLFLEVYRHADRLFVHPHKVAHRYSPTMYMLHEWKTDEDFSPVLDSGTIAEVMADSHWVGLNPARNQLSIWDRVFLQGEELLEASRNGHPDPRREQELYRRIMRMMFTRDRRVLELAERYLGLRDLLTIRNRMIGSGLIGGKAVGMLLARAILRHADPRFDELLEPHDSFFVGSDVFYTFLVQNGCWWVRRKQRSIETYLEGSEEARRRILTGTFPDYLYNQLKSLLNYFGQSPIIVRSSSLLEDNFGNAFAGKYDSVFCASQGPIEKRLEDLLAAIRTIYASAMSERALRYRAQRGLLDQDEQMALLVQRVSGSQYDHLFYPQLAGVGLSFNPYVWSEQIDPEAGVMRLVLGLGTRAVDRYDDDYTRVVALNAPQRRPEHTFDQIRQYAQRKVDVIDCSANRQVTCDFRVILKTGHDLPMDIFTSRGEDGGGDSSRWLSFDNLLSKTDFVRDIRQILSLLQAAYAYPIEMEFAANFVDDARYRINVLQCRPLQVQGGGSVIGDPPKGLAGDDVILEAHGAVIGQSRLCRVDRLIHVDPAVYGRMTQNERYGVARRVGQITRLTGRDKTVMLIGPGRWGTKQPELGVSVSFAEINSVSILCEIVTMHENLSPEVSLGTHFFNELVEAEILYLALFPDQPGNRLNEAFFAAAPNRLAELLPDEAGWARAIHVIDLDGEGEGTAIRLYANTLKQQVICYRETTA